MSAMRMLSFGTVVAVLIATGGYAAEQGYSSLTSDGNYSAAPRTHQHSGFRRYGMTRELKVLWRKEVRAELKGLPKGERGARLRSEWASMTDAQRKAKVAELRAKWAALDPKVREAILAKLEYKKARGGRRGASMGGEMSPAE